MTSDKYLSVTAITKYIKHKIDNDEHLKCVFIKGEISNFKNHNTGHLYFSLKDETSKINAIMFAKQAVNLNFAPTDGMKVLVIGRISVYEATGNYQIYIDEMLEDGLGNLYIAFEKLKKELELKGLFDISHKRPIPKYPRRIGIVTAKTGAAIKDILSTIKRRYPICDTFLFPSLVQGENAASDIVNKIEQANTYNLDLLIVGRGGGSIEDLWPFNEEKVAYAIYNSSIPVISAVGHEVDFTIADFVADLRAPTPTGAAEMAVPNLADVVNHTEQLVIRLNEAINKKVKFCTLYLDTIKNAYVLKTPMLMYENKKQAISLLIEKMVTLIQNKYNTERRKFDNLKNHYLFVNPKELYAKDVINLNNIIEKLELLNPLKILKRGYALTIKDNITITSVKNVKINDTINIKLYDGVLVTNVNNILEEENDKSKI